MLFNILSLICNAIIFLSTLVSLVIFFVKGGEGNMKVSRFRCFVYFTVDSNVLAMLVSGIVMIFNIKGLASGGALALPYWAVVLKLVASTAVMLTFVVTATLLAPFAKEGYFSLFKGTSFFMHFLTPVLAALSFILFEAGTKVGYIMILPSLIPTVIYGIVYFIMVLIIGEEKGGWKDFYGFNKGGRWYLSAPLILTMTAILSFALILLHNLASK